MVKEPLFITGDNISVAWAKAFLETIEPGVYEICPLTITVAIFNDGSEIEKSVIRNTLDVNLKKCSKFMTNTTANTIFPKSLWNPEFPAERLYKRYLRIIPVLKRIAPQNRYGTYFERLIAYGVEKRNQLDYIIRTYRSGNHRNSNLQVAIFDPSRDQTNQWRRGFPCLQQIAFNANQRTGHFTVHGFYATQYLFDRCYGNLLGLTRLGFFLSHELGLQLTRVSCTASSARYGEVNRSHLRDLSSQLISFLKEVED